MKIFGIGDLLIPQEYIQKGFAPFEKAGWQVETMQWDLGSYEELQNINLLVETKGSEAYEDYEYYEEWTDSKEQTEEAAVAASAGE